MMLKDRVLLVTHVHKFSGHGVTRLALAEGARVIAHDEGFAAEARRREYEAAFPGVTAIAAQEPAAVVAATLDRAGRLDALISNDAYPAVRAPLVDARLEDFRAALETMVVQPFALAQQVVPVMRRQKAGRIVFVSSAAPLRGIPNYSMYVAARAGTLGLVQSWAKEFGRDGITVNAVGSNYVENPDYFPPALLANAEAMKKILAQIPLGRLGTPAELAAAVCFLCSEGAGFITGHTLAHAGGWA
ncbi:MAG: SDR family oxidoreductase [Alphaproteobacteria bacterium]|nr:SDR family oxidoreductase [Alphaproteobacteria bacterium]